MIGGRRLRLRYPLVPMSDTTPESPETPEPSLIGQTVGKYRVTRLIGKGGMGAVYELVHQTIGQRAALKVLFQKYAQEPEFVARFLSEAQVVNKIEHPGLVKISDHGQLPDGALYILMEYLEGETLRARLESLSSAGQQMQQNVAQELVRQLAETLRVVHEHNVVHRDLKPENIFLLRDPAALHGERVKILDFGIAKISDGSELNHRDSPGPLTTVGKVLGTPTYMSPEQCEGQGVLTGRSDAYALGVIWFELLSGTPPFATGSANTIMAQHLLKPPPAIRSIRADVPPVLESLLLRLLAKKPDERPNMPALLDALTKLTGATDGPTRRPQPLLLLFGLVVAAVVMTGVAWLAGRSPTAGPRLIPGDAGVRGSNLQPTEPPAVDSGHKGSGPSNTLPSPSASQVSAVPQQPKGLLSTVTPPARPANKSARATSTSGKGGGGGKKSSDVVHPSADDVPIVKLPDDP